MANTIILKKSSVAAKVPQTTDLVYGELALNYTDGKLYYKTASNTIAQIGGGTPGGSDTQVQFNDGGAFGGSSGFTYNKTTSTATLTNLTVSGTATIAANSLDIGTDASITDINTAHTLGVVSLTNSAQGFIKFGTGSALGYNGTNLLYGSDIVLHAGNYNTYAPALTGTGASGTWGITITGSAATLTTARTLTIGGTGKTFNGSANVSWTLAEIGAVGTSGNETITGNKTFSGTTALAAGSTIDSIVVGYRDIPITIQNATYSFALADAGKGFGKDNGTAYTYTIPANASVAFPVGTAITVFNNNATSNITIAITTDTLRLAGTTTTGSRTIAPFGLCTLYKVSSTVWFASGPGVT